MSGQGSTKAQRVQIFDTTLRDGEQSPGATMNVEEKLMMARQLEKLGVDVIEAGFAASSEGDFEAISKKRSGSRDSFSARAKASHTPSMDTPRIMLLQIFAA